MDNQHEREQVDGSLPEIVAAFQDLTHLSHHGIATTNEVPFTVEAALLKRLMVLCQASRGAIFLAIPSPTASEPLSSFSVFNRNDTRLFALSGMNEEEAQALFTTFSSESLWTSPPASDPSWLHWRLPLTLSFPFPRDENREQQEATDSKTSLYALLLFGWDGQDEAHRVMASKRACVVLPLLADAVGTVIVRVLSISYINELEASADGRALREMDLLKAELLATVSHELRSPLASIKGYTTTLLRHDRRISREERHEFLLAINGSSDRLARVITSLLEISELETGTIEIERTSVNIVHLALEAIGVAEQRLAGSGEARAITPSAHRYPTFVVHLQDRHGEPTQDDLVIEADQSRLREVLDHLLQNAIFHTPEDGIIDVTIRSVLSAEDSKQFALASHATAAKIAAMQQRYQQLVVISVRDTGRGIPSRHLTKIFDPFYRVDTRLTREVNGLGLGLAISRRIVELHEGTLWVESEIGKGSTFYVCLPVYGNSESDRTKAS